MSTALEFGKPLACATTWGNAFGLATPRAPAPSVDVAIDRVDTDSVDGCCLYTCPPD